MSLSEMPNGRIIMLAGGTGLHPFCDLIDLLYKETLVQQNQPLSKEIISQNPLVRQRTLTERWKFCIYIAVEYTDEIHDLTASQLNHLSRSRVMEVFFTDPPISASYILIYRLSIKDFNITLPSWLPK